MVRRWSPTPLCDTLPRRDPLIRPTSLGGHRSSCLSLCRLTSLTEIEASCAARFAHCNMSLSCHFHTLHPFTCADDSCFSLSCTRATIPTILNFAYHSFFCVKLHLNAFTPAAALLFSLTWLRTSWPASTPRLRHVCADRPVCTSGGASQLSHSCFKDSWHRFVCCRSRLFLVNLVFALLTRLWTDVWIFFASLHP